MTLRQRLTRRRLWLEAIWACLTRDELRLVVVAKEFGRIDREIRRTAIVRWSIDRDQIKEMTR